MLKKIRYIPFGYQMVQGKAIENPDEKAVVESIYQKYLLGMSIKQLAVYATQTGVPYRENAEGWNKNMVARILEDERYWNGKQYPPIIEKELAMKVLDLKKGKTSPRSGIPYIQKKMVCSVCQHPLSRSVRKKPGIFWHCRHCQKIVGPVDDEELQYMIADRIHNLCQSPKIIESNAAFSSQLSIQAIRLTNEINQMLDQREIDPEKALALILECAAEKYYSCQVQGRDYQTLKIQKLLEAHIHDESLNQELFEQIVEKVILHPGGSVQLELINHKII